MKKIDFNNFQQTLITGCNTDSFVKATLSKPSRATSSQELKSILIHLILIKSKPWWKITFRYNTKDEVKNIEFTTELAQLLDHYLPSKFLNADIFLKNITLKIKYNNKNEASYFSDNAQESIKAVDTTHNREKKYMVSANKAFLKALGISNHEGEILPTSQKKYKQINKFIEIVEHTIHDFVAEKKQIKIVDVGSGKGYLTFALYDYIITNYPDLSVDVLGVELRENLVQQCNDLAQKLGYGGLHFVQNDINNIAFDSIDLLIALHACDTATDIAISKGILATAKFIIVAPCCHKQLRPQINCKNSLASILNNGILMERQSEMITDGIRALILQDKGYQTKVFEFISLDHTPKNIMIVASKAKRNNAAMDQILALKEEFGIEHHYLEGLL
ncbi:MAG: SAM-dependent methyltransferase [Saprospiraceae bacterium]|nr:SAM-dependent methyltransferase [Saprospiraceae bacterium]